MFSTKLGRYEIQTVAWGKSKTEKNGNNVNLSDHQYYSLNYRRFSDENREISNKKCIEGGLKYVPRIYQYGQDCIGIYKHNNMLITINSDGHGGIRPLCLEGGFISYYSVLFTIIEVSKNINTIKKLYMSDGFDNYMNNILQNIDDYLMYKFLPTMNYISGGTTLTVNIKFIKHNKLVSITTNIGDSLLVRLNRTQKGISLTEETMELNCDTLEAYNLYIKKCNSLKITPKKIFLSRFNCTNGFKIPWICDDNGPIPIEPFKLINDGEKYHAVENYSTMRLFYNNAPIIFKQKYLHRGGTQSIRGLDNKMEILKGNYPPTNFGNTSEGICQCLPGSSIGDAIQKTKGKKMMLSHTHVQIYNNSNHETEILGTDGFFDTISYNEIKTIYNDNRLDIHALRTNLINKMNSNIIEHKWGNSWDDVTMCISTIKKIKK